MFDKFLNQQEETLATSLIPTPKHQLTNVKSTARFLGPTATPKEFKEKEKHHSRWPSTGQLTGQLSESEWLNLSKEVRKFITDLDLERDQSRLTTERIDFEEEGVVYNGEINSKQEFYGEGTCTFKSGDVVKSTWRKGKEHGYSKFFNFLADISI